MNTYIKNNMSSPAYDKNGKPLQRGNIVKYGNAAECRYRVVNAFENAGGITQVQVEPMTGQAHMYVSEQDIELINEA